SDAVPQASHPVWLPIWTIVWVFVGGFLFCHIIINGVCRLPIAWDSLVYHLPLIDQWIAAQSLYSPQGFYWSYPHNYGILCHWLVAHFSSDFMCPLASLMILVLLCSSVFTLA